MIVALIPTATKVSYACLAGLGRNELIDANVVMPSSSAAIMHEPPPGLATYLHDADLRTITRITGMTLDVLDLVDEHQPRRVLIRVPCAKMGMHPSGRSSQAMYGLAAGAIWAAMLTHWPERCVPVTDRRWRAERGSKQAMRDELMQLYSRFDAAEDPQGDVANAVGMARWMLKGIASNKS